jgi:hypothetical protein
MNPFVSIWNYLVRLYVRHFIKIDDRAKCPSCGTVADHKITFVPLYQKVLHQCGVAWNGDKQFGCGALWGEDTIVPAAKWQVVMPAEMDEILELKQMEELQKTQESKVASRTPTVVRSA